SSNFGNMLSMAGGVLVLPFLPMLPIQILLNNLLYDISEIAIPMDRVDDDMVERPRHWDIRFVRNFMLTLGPISSLFDFLTFSLLFFLFRAAAPMFQTGWFVESMATQVLVIFIIRTRANPLKSRPHPLLAATSIAIAAVAVVLPYTALGSWFGFVPMPASLLVALSGMTLVYLVIAEGAKRWFYTKWPPPARTTVSARDLTASLKSPLAEISGQRRR
ncbi:MAG: cation transporting ATPase C-terminal domain-containing protein, partial [Alphaproteobacteria bacterium]|nr:cation transporting ATPase C-terminal domain-containing protein [Alphaproteobacteria bacterium]